MSTVFDQLNDLLSFSHTFFAEVLRKVQFHPSYYAFLFPPVVTRETVYQLIDDKVFPILPDLAPAFTYAIILSLLRFVLQYSVVKALAEFCMSIKSPELKRNKKVDELIPISSTTVLSESTLKVIASKADMDVKEIRKYLWKRRMANAVNKRIVKFVEAFWRALFYTMFSVLGYYALFVPETAEWIVDSSKNWIGWPYHEVTSAVRFYYQIELGCYFHQLAWTEVSRSDSLEMISHHIITILLLIASYLSNYTRVGVTILLLHDISDIFLEVAKVFNYTSKAPGRDWMKSFLVDPIFAVFAITFFITRLYLYPRVILTSMLTEGYNAFGCEWGGCYFYCGLLFSLQFLHLFWFYLIGRMIYKMLFTKDGTTKDERSDDEEEIEEYKED